MRTGSLPRYLQISELLTRDIAAGRLADGARLPPEKEMAVQLGVAVGTLRQALKRLEEKGLLVRVQGSGNYVRSGTDPGSVYAFFRLELPEGGGLPTAEVLSIDRLPKDPGLPAFGSSDEGHRIRRLRFLSGAVAAVEEIWFDGSHVDRLAPQDVTESLYLTYRTRFGLWVARAEDWIGQAPLPDWTPPRFSHPPGTPLPCITRLTWAHDGTAIEASRTWYDPARAVYVARLT